MEYAALVLVVLLAGFSVWKIGELASQAVRSLSDAQQSMADTLDRFTAPPELTMGNPEQPTPGLDPEVLHNAMTALDWTDQEFPSADANSLDAPVLDWDGV